MTSEDIASDIVQFQAMLQRIPRDDDPDNLIARQIYESLIEERRALAHALRQETA